MKARWLPGQIKSLRLLSRFYSARPPGSESEGDSWYLACLRLLQYVNWHDRSYWEFNASIGLYAVVLFAIMAFVMYFDPRMPDLRSGPCHVSRYESC
jgi:hypothetical protein